MSLGNWSFIWDILFVEWGPENILPSRGAMGIACMGKCSLMLDIIKPSRFSLSYWNKLSPEDAELLASQS